MLKTQFKFIFTIVLVLGLSISLQSLLASWQAPTATPPGSNIDRPINVGHSSQTKNGELIVNNDFTVTMDALVVGTVSAASFIYTSDRRLKKDINHLDNSLSRILSLEGVEFKWRDDEDLNIGLIAQDVEKVFPEIVHTSKGGIKSVEYGNLVAPLIEAIKEQQIQITNLEKKINELEIHKN